MNLDLINFIKHQLEELKEGIVTPLGDPKSYTVSASHCAKTEVITGREGEASETNRFNTLSTNSVTSLNKQEITKHNDYQTFQT